MAHGQEELAMASRGGRRQPVIFFWADLYYSVNCHIITNRFHVNFMTSIKHKLIANQLHLTAVLTQS